MKLNIILILLFLVFSLGHSYKLEWNLEIDKRIEVVKTAQVKYFKDTTLIDEYEERNVIDLKVLAKTNSLNYVSGTIKTFRRYTNRSVFNLEDTYNSDFIIQNDGKYIIALDHDMPNIRHIPTFPTNDIDVGYEWSAYGEEFIISLSPKIMIGLDVNYKLNKVGTLSNINVAYISNSFEINSILTGKNANRKDNLHAIIALDDGVLVWDLDNNLPLYSDEIYKILFGFSNATIEPETHTLVMNIRSDYKIYDKLDASEIKESIEDFEDEIEEKFDVEVLSDAEKIVFRLGDVLFDFDSSELNEKSTKVLEAISDIIKRKYPGREIIVEGRTDSVGDETYNYNLSKDRAYNVSEYVKDTTDEDNISYKGYGELNPIYSNEDEEGRRKNRRVDIIIKIN